MFLWRARDIWDLRNLSFVSCRRPQVLFVLNFFVYLSPKPAERSSHLPRMYRTSVIAWLGLREEIAGKAAKLPLEVHCPCCSTRLPRRGKPEQFQSSVENDTKHIRDCIEAVQAERPEQHESDLFSSSQPALERWPILVEFTRSVFQIIT